jgi:hypothetical protein
MPWSNSVAWMRTSQPVRSPDERPPQPGAGAPLGHVCGRDPGLGQPALRQRRAHPSARPGGRSWRAACCRGAPASRPSRPGAGRPQPHAAPHTRTPTRAGLDRDDDPPAPEAPNPTAHRLPVRRNAPTVDLARFRIERVEGDLTSVHVKPIGASSKSSDICHFARVSRAERGRPPFMRSPRRRQRKPVGPLRLCGGESESEPIMCRRASLAVGLVRTRGSRCRSLRSSGRGEARAGGADTDATAALLAAISLALAAGNPARCPRWV